MSANHASFGPSALKSRFTRSGADSLLEARFPPLGVLGAAPGHAAPAVLPHCPGRALSRDALAAALQDPESLRRAVDATAGLVNFKYLRRELRAAKRVLGGGRLAVRVVSLPGDLQRRAQLRHRVLAAEHRDELELSPLHRALLAKRALAFKRISFSRFRTRALQAFSRHREPHRLCCRKTAIPSCTPHSGSRRPWQGRSCIRASCSQTRHRRM